MREHRVPAERVDVVDRGDEAGEQLVLAGAELVAVPDGLVRGRAHLVRAPRSDQLLLAERHPHVRPVELVRRAEEDVDVPGRDVDRAVRAVVDGVGPGERADAVGELDDPPHVRRRADRVGRDRERDDARAVAELRGEVVVVEREVVVHARRGARRCRGPPAARATARRCRRGRASSRAPRRRPSARGRARA